MATRKVGYRWRLRRLMAEQDLFQTTELVPLLAERGVGLSREQVYRLVTNTPIRLNLEVLAALCDILDCLPGDLIECHSGSRPARHDTEDGADRAANNDGTATGGARPRPRRARVVRNDQSSG